MKMLENIINKTNFKDIFLIILLSFAIVCFWRGTWNLLDKFLFPDNFLLSQLISIILGILVLFIFAKLKLKKSKK